MDYEIKKLDAVNHQMAVDLFTSFQKEDGVKSITHAPKDYIIDLLTREDFIVIVAIIENKVVGGLTAYELRKYKRQESEVYVYELGVEIPFQRQGIATALINCLKAICREKNIKQIFLGALADNSQAIGFYESIGGVADDVVEFTFEVD